MAAVTAAQAQEPVRQDAALQEGVELVFDKLRQIGAGSVFGLCEESRSVLLHQAVQRGLLGSVARVVDRGDIAMRPPGLVSVGLHALGMENLGWCSFSRRAGQRIRLLGGSATPGATATSLQRRSTLPGSAAAGHAVAATRDGIPGRIYPTIRDGAFHAREKPSIDQKDRKRLSKAA